MPSVSCTDCGKTYRVTAESAGKKFKCKHCGNLMRVPATNDLVASGVSSSSAVGSSATSSRPPAVATSRSRTGASVSNPSPLSVAVKKLTPPPVAPARMAAPPPVPSFDDISEDEVNYDAMSALEDNGAVDNSIPFVPERFTPAPARATRAAFKAKPVKKQGPRFGFRLNRGVIILIVIGISLIIWGGREYSLASNSSATPQDITCADLQASGPGDNLHVRITNFLLMGNYVYQKNPQTDELKTVWIPIVSPDLVKTGARLRKLGNLKFASKESVDSSQIRVLIKTSKVKSEADIPTVMDRTAIEGMVVNKIDKLTDNERNLLQQAYPAIDVNTTYIVEDGREPQGGMGMLLIVGGLIVAGLGGLLMFKPAM